MDRTLLNKRRKFGAHIFRRYCMSNYILGIGSFWLHPVHCIASRCRVISSRTILVIYSYFPFSVMPRSHCVRARTWRTRTRTHVHVRARCNRNVDFYDALCAWCCVIFAATSRSIAQYQHNLHIIDYCVQLHRHASTDVHARERTTTHVDVHVVVRARAWFCMRPRVCTCAVWVKF